MYPNLFLFSICISVSVCFNCVSLSFVSVYLRSSAYVRVYYSCLFPYVFLVSVYLFPYIRICLFGNIYLFLFLFSISYLFTIVSIDRFIKITQFRVITYYIYPL